jgi:hypothetical protein
MGNFPIESANHINQIYKTKWLIHALLRISTESNRILDRVMARKIQIYKMAVKYLRPRKQ